MNILSAILFLILGVFLGGWFSLFLTRPKLRVIGSGSGGGPGPGYYQNNVRIGNQPGLIGIKLKESVLFGRKINNNIVKGLTFDRTPARECRANLLDKKTGHFLCPLWWRTVDGKLVQKVTINSGESVELMLFARLNEEVSKYFVYEPVSEVGDIRPKQPSNEAKFDKTQSFLVDIQIYNRKKLKLTVTIHKGYKGSLSYLFGDGGGGSF